MNQYKVIAIAAIIVNFCILAALEGGAIGCGMTLLLVIPAQGLLIRSLDHSGWIDTNAVEKDKRAMIAAVKALWKGGEADEHNSSKVD